MNEDGQNPAEVTVQTEAEMTTEQLTALTEAEDFIANFKDEDLVDPVKSAELAEKLKSAKTTIAQKRHYRDKLAEATKVVPPVVTPPKPADTAEKKEIPSADRVEFRQDHPEFSKEVVKVIADHATAYGVTLDEALKNPVIQKYVKDVAVAEDVEDASVTPARHPGGNTADRDWSSASPAEMEAARNKMLFPNG